MLPRLTLVVAFRETGWRRPLEDPVALEVWGPNGHLLATLPASHVRELVRWHLAAVSLQGALTAYLEPPPPALPAATGRRLRGRPASGGLPAARLDTPLPRRGTDRAGLGVPPPILGR